MPCSSGHSGEFRVLDEQEVAELRGEQDLVETLVLHTYVGGFERNGAYFADCHCGYRSPAMEDAVAAFADIQRHGGEEFQKQQATITHREV